MFSPAKSVLHLTRVTHLSPSLVFLISTLMVNGGNYLYNLLLGRILAPSLFSEAGLLVALLLIFSFLAMTFQIVSAKFSVEFEGEVLTAFKNWINALALVTGVLLALAVIAFNDQLTRFFQLDNRWTFFLFALGLPFFFIMGNLRGLRQGAGQLMELSASYQMEMWVRIIITFGLIFTFPIHSSNIAAIGIACSIVGGLIATGPSLRLRAPTLKPFSGSGRVLRFFFLTAGYEFAQILINYTDLLLAKHYFAAETAGQYTSMALIGRMIYSVTWMLVMILIPKVLKSKKLGLPFRHDLIRYVVLITAFSGTLTILAFLFPRSVVILLFGEAYLPVAPMLWMYALATMFFALANLFVYYFLSLEIKGPVYFAIGSGLLQTVLLSVFHGSPYQFVMIQIINMGFLLGVMIWYFIKPVLVARDQKN